jgi:hypothetical protein
VANRRPKPEEIVTMLRQVDVLVGQDQRLGNITRLHGRVQLLGNDSARVIIKDR